MGGCDSLRGAGEGAGGCFGGSHGLVARATESDAGDGLCGVGRILSLEGTPTNVIPMGGLPTGGIS